MQKLWDMVMVKFFYMATRIRFCSFRELQTDDSQFPTSEKVRNWLTAMTAAKKKLVCWKLGLHNY